MALVLNPMMSEQARGRVGGVVFSKAKNGATAKGYIRPVRRVRTTQPFNRGLLAYCASYWGTMTNEERESWRDWAASHPKTNKFGDSYIQSGFNAFVEVTSKAIRINGLAAVPSDTAPVSDLDVSIGTLVASDGLADGIIVFTWSHFGVADEDDWNELQIAGPFTSPGRVEVTNYNFHKKVAGNLLTVNTDELQILAWYWGRVRYVREDGLVSPWMYAQWQAPDIA